MFLAVDSDSGRFLSVRTSLKVFRLEWSASQLIFYVVLIADVVIIHHLVYAICVHTNITITATEFRIKRKFYFKQKYRDSYTNHEDYVSEPSFWEKLWLSQAFGLTLSLTEAKV